MTILVLGGVGFIGRRLVPLLAQQGNDVVCMDTNPGPASFEEFGQRVRVVRGDIRQFDDLMAVTAAARPTCMVNLAYMLGSEHAPRVAFKLNVLGMDNCFEVARIMGVEHVVFASSLAVAGEQTHFGERSVNEQDFRHGHVQYAMHKIFNEMQAQDYREKHGMQITAIRPANVTGVDKIVGSVDHVQVITAPAVGEPISLPYKDAMRCPIHVDEVAEIFAKVVMTDKPKYSVYSTGGTPISLGQIADIVREYIPDAQISFEHETGGKDLSGNYLIDNSRLVDEFDVHYRPYRERVVQIINEARRDRGLKPVVGDT